MENNRDVTYRGADGKPMGFRTNDALIDGLISHAGNRTIPAHLTHDWTDGKQDALLSRVGGVKNFRKDESGALLADYHAIPGVEGDKILWLAENDPEHAMLSLVFDYNAIESNGVKYAVPLNFESADFVAKGAAVSAMLSKLPTETDMTKEDIVALIKENSISKDDLKAALADFKPATISKEEVAEIVKANLADFKPTVSDDQLKELATKAEASFTAKLGAGPLQLNLDANKKANTYEAKLAEYEKNAPNPATAAARLMKDHPELAESRQQHLAATRARLTHAA